MKKLLLISAVLMLAGCTSQAPATGDASHASTSQAASSTVRESGTRDATRTKQRVNSYFSPNGEARDAMIREIGKAKREILVALYYFTDPKMAEALVDAKKRGCDVRMVLDRTQSNRKDSQAKTVVDAGIAVTFDHRHRIMHHKFCVIDRDTLITGSQNWTESSQTANAENTLIIHENRHLAEKYRETFLRLAAQTTTNVKEHSKP